MGPKTALGVILLAVAYSWGTLTSAEDEFYLTLVPSTAECENEVISSDSEPMLGSEDTILMESASGGVAENDTECVFSSEVKVKCSCGDELRKTRDKYKDTVMMTCDRYDELSDSSSPLSICDRSLSDLQRGYKICSVGADGTLDPLSFTNSSLAKKVQEIEKQVELFRVILDRTITGVLVASNFSKCLCLVSGLQIEDNRWKLDWYSATFAL